MDANFNWNTQQHAAQFDGGIVHFSPTTTDAGLLVEVTDATIEDIKDNKGRQVVIKVKALEAPDMGKVVDVRFGIFNNDMSVAQKAAGYFNGALLCLGIVGQLNSLSALKQRRARVIVNLSSDQERFPGSTNVNGWRDQNGNKPGNQPLSAGGNGAGQPQGQQGGGWGNQQQTQQAQQPINNGGGFQPQQGQQGQQGGGFDPNQGQTQQTQQFQQPNGGGGFQTNYQPQGGGFDPNQNNGGGNFQQGQQGQGDKPAWA